MMIEFCLPVKNEEKILAVNARRLYDFLLAAKPSYDWRIVIIVNGSSDSSWALASQLTAEDADHFQAEHLAIEGKGAALKKYFLLSRADILVFMDVDLAVSLKNLSGLLSPLLADQADLMIGSRLLFSSRTERSFWRSFTSRVYNLLSRFLLGHDLSDLQCGFKAMRRSLFEDLSAYLKDDAWFFDTELTAWSLERGWRVQEIAVDWQENRYDRRQSKIKVLRDAWPFVLNLLKLRRRLRANHKRSR